MKRGLGMTFGLGALAMIASCAAIANLQEPLPSEDLAEPRPRGDDAGASPATTSRDAGEAAPFYDAGPTGPIDAGPTPEQCVNVGGAKNLDPCEKPSDCCSGQCIETRVCVSACVPPGGACNPLEQATCCVRSYCTSQGFPSCVPCRERGQQAERDPVLTLPLARSCCSRSATFDGTCN